ncbi:MAG: protein-export chaperone SecB [Proteobacteria bacterium]|nr:protein-export chaperone SecB [Pseudomonadota bacterium]
MQDSASNQANQSIQLGIVRVYVKDLSFESPRSPQIFRTQWRPEIKLDVSVTPRHIEESLFEVVLAINVEARENKDLGFIVEVEQCGLFDVRGPEGQPMEHALRVVCPNVLFPYARQAVDQALVAGGFPPLMLAPINFELPNHQKPANLS